MDLPLLRIGFPDNQTKKRNMDSKKMTKEQKYELLVAQVSSLLEGETNWTARLAETCAAIHDAMGFFWVGFYLVEDEQLVIGPFQGSVACLRIPKGKGVCGTSWEQRKTLIVKDVEDFPGHIACSSLSKSEIVVPLFNAENEVIGVLDIDSDELSTFDEIDAKYLEEIVKILNNSIGFSTK